MGTTAPVRRVVTEPRRVGNPYFPKRVPTPGKQDEAPEYVPQIKDPEKVTV